MTIMWRAYPECIFAHVYLWSRVNFANGDEIVDDTACGLTIDRRDMRFRDVQPTESEKCEECFAYECQEIMKELSK